MRLRGLRLCIKAVIAALGGLAGVVACSGPAEVDVMVATRIHGISENRVERLEDAAEVRLSRKSEQYCVDLYVAAPTGWEESARADEPFAGGAFCNEWHSEQDVLVGGSGSEYVPPSYGDLNTDRDSIWGDLIYGVGRPGHDAVVVTRDGVDVVVPTDEVDGITAFVVWWRGSGSPGDPVPIVSVRPAP